MQDTSLITNYDAIILTGKYTVETKLNINGVDYGEDVLINVETTPTLFNNVPSVGNCPSAEISVTMLTPNETIPPMAMLKPYIRLIGEELTSGWLQKGEFFIDTREQTGYENETQVLKIHGYDAMLKAENGYPDNVNPSDYPMTDTDVVDVIAAAIGVEVDQRTYDIMSDGYLINLPATYSMREVLSYLASMYAGNFCISPEGKLRLVSLVGIGFETNYLIDQIGEAIVFGEDRILV